MADKSLNFDDYRKYSSDPNPTKNSELQDYLDNQNRLTTELTEQLLWQPMMAYEVGDIVHSRNIAGGRVAKCTQAGISGNEEPTWNAIVADGTCAWRLIPEGGEVDSSLSSTSENPVQAKVIKLALDNKLDIDGVARYAQFDSGGNLITFTANGIKSALGNTPVNRAVADQNGNTINAVMENALLADGTMPNTANGVQSKVIRSALLSGTNVRAQKDSSGNVITSTYAHGIQSSRSNQTVTISLKSKSGATLATCAFVAMDHDAICSSCSSCSCGGCGGSCGD